MENSKSSNWFFKAAPIIAAVGFLAVAVWQIVVSSWNGHTYSPRNNCINNLRQLDAAVQEWALENKKVPGDTPKWSEITNYLRSPLPCPQGGIYNPGSVGGRPTCSIAGHDLPRDPP
jgi:hypothetical protein